MMKHKRILIGLDNSFSLIDQDKPHNLVQIFRCVDKAINMSLNQTKQLLIKKNNESNVKQELMELM